LIPYPKLVSWLVLFVYLFIYLFIYYLFIFVVAAATSYFIPTNKLVLPPKGRQFRRVNELFINSLEAELEWNPAGSYGALFVVDKGISNKQQWKHDEKDSFTYEVLGGTHSFLAYKE